MTSTKIERFYRVTANFPDGSSETILTGEPMVHFGEYIKNGALLVVVALVEKIIPNIWRDNK